MPEESNDLPTSRVARWAATGALILLAVALYFRDGRRTAPLTAPPPALAPGQPTH
ncbi:MAG TPA: hypothetical protein VH158_06345 [Gemmatimonadales bacterium]|jgi:hypothetical protein|nr:hypothetical protein [Gemmatimonadales bacterium]